ncbi:MAG: hypothetical protein M9951_00995 [Burkholderiaceae bacterium]|jgi:nucleotide-binding universal stress UspA family protein|nr:hypothetical protein [Burkholderiaceae bacterium]MEB2319457.1 hypothetical protein [Pseudomonadota bacterium]
MTESHGVASPGRRRILVAIDPARVRAAPIAAAALLARELDMELTAILIEEQSWLRVAALPFARELQLASGQWQPFDAGGVERLFREQMRRAESMLARVCAERQTRFTVTVERGTYPRRAIESASAADWLVLDRGGAGNTEPNGYRRIAAAFDGSPAADRALAAAAAIARDGRKPLRVLLLAQDPARFPALRERARTIVGEGLAPEFGRASDGAPAAILARLADGGRALLVIGPGLAEPAAIAQPALSGCAVLLAR